MYRTSALLTMARKAAVDRQFLQLSRPRALLGRAVCQRRAEILALALATAR